MWQLPREVFDLDIENLKKVKRMKKKTERVGSIPF